MIRQLFMLAYAGICAMFARLKPPVYEGRAVRRSSRRRSRGSGTFTRSPGEIMGYARRKRVSRGCRRQSDGTLLRMGR